MPLYVFSLVAVSAIAAWSAVHHGLVAWRQRNATQRSFALLATVVSAECIGRVIFHSSDSQTLLQQLDLLIGALQLLECWLLLDFVHRFTGAQRRWPVMTAGAILAALTVALFALPYGFFASAPKGVLIHLLPWGETHARLDAPYGTAYWIMVTVAMSTLMLNLTLAWSAWRRSGLRRHLFLLASLLLIVAVVSCNVGADIRGTILPPLVEHGFAGLALVMGMVLTDQALTAARLEERLRRNERLTALGQLAGGVAHDFGNILTGVIGSAELLEAGLADRPKEQQLIHAVGVSGQRGLALVQQLTAFASGRQAAAERIELHGLLREVAALIQTGRGRSITVDFQLHAPLTEIDGDPAQLHSLVLNLLVNARDAMGSGGGRVVIRSGLGQPTANLHLRHRPRGENLIWFSVSDSGPGIGPEVMPHIFDSFFTTKGHSGTGLGLAQVDKALLALGGGIAVESLPGHGATFQVWLPLTEDSSCFLPAAGTRVLVWIEDATLRLLIGQTLEALGYRTLLAVDETPGTTVEAIVTDGDRGDTPTGPRQRLPHTPVVLLGGRASDASPNTLVLGKPFEPRDLAMALRKIVTRSARRH